jgi:anti-sigma regulatory factor (Ser/Thr protein kinase)
MTDNARRRRRPGVDVTASDGESLTLDQAFDGDSLYALRAAVAAHGSQAGLSEGRTRDLVLAVHELAANAVRHGAGQGRLRLWAAHDAVRCEITDEGAPGEADAADAARWQAEPGHGLWLVRRIADSASVQSGASGTVAAVIFRRVRS